MGRKGKKREKERMKETLDRKTKQSARLGGK